MQIINLTSLNLFQNYVGWSAKDLQRTLDLTDFFKSLVLIYFLGVYTLKMSETRKLLQYTAGTVTINLTLLVVFGKREKSGSQVTRCW